MEKIEVQKLIRILLQCDGGCEYCVSTLLKLFIDEFPEYKELSEKAFREKFGEELEDFLTRNEQR